VKKGLKSVKKRVLNKGILAEENSSVRLGMRLTPGSGNQWHSKGDFKNQDYLVEHKSTVHNSISIKKAWWDKICEEAFNEMRTPVISVVFSDKHGKPVDNGCLIIISELEFKNLCSLKN
jgi:hypothetical protein